MTAATGISGSSARKGWIANSMMIATKVSRSANIPPMNGSRSAKATFVTTKTSDQLPSELRLEGDGFRADVERLDRGLVRTAREDTPGVVFLRSPVRRPSGAGAPPGSTRNRTNRRVWQPSSLRGPRNHYRVEGLYLQYR